MCGLFFWILFVYISFIERKKELELKNRNIIQMVHFKLFRLYSISFLKLLEVYAKFTVLLGEQGEL